MKWNQITLSQTPNYNCASLNTLFHAQLGKETHRLLDILGSKIYLPTNAPCSKIYRLRNISLTRCNTRQLVLKI